MQCCGPIPELACLGHHAVVARSVTACEDVRKTCGFKLTAPTAADRINTNTFAHPCRPMLRYSAAWACTPGCSCKLQQPKHIARRSLGQPVHEQRQHSVHAHAGLQLRQRAQQRLQCAQVELVCRQRGENDSAECCYR